MKIGIAGFGKMGLLHTGILNRLEDIEIVAVAEKEGFLKKYMKEVLPKANVYEDYDTMLEKENLDLLYITTPTGLHYPMILSSIKKRLDFFVEKPFVKNLEEAKIICSQLKHSNIIHAVGYNLRFASTFSKAKTLLDAGILGELNTVNSSMYVSNIFSKPKGWRFRKKESGGGVLLQFGCHLVDLLLWYFGSISTVIGSTKSVYSIVEDFAHMKMEFRNGLTGDFDTSWSKEGGYRIQETSVEIEGSNGYMKVNEDLIDIKLKNKIPEFEKLETRIYKQSLNDSVSFDIGGPEYTRQDSHMIRCVKEQKIPINNAFEASKTQSVIQAAYDSAKTNEKKIVDYIE